MASQQNSLFHEHLKRKIREKETERLNNRDVEEEEKEEFLVSFEEIILFYQKRENFSNRNSKKNGIERAI